MVVVLLGIEKEAGDKRHSELYRMFREHMKREAQILGMKCDEEK
jgi:hypothetical protein